MSQPSFLNLLMNTCRRAKPAMTVKDGRFAASTTAEGVLFTRKHGRGYAQMGPYWTVTSCGGPGRAQQYLALPPGNTAANMVHILVPAGTTIYEGQAASAFGKLGGGNQLFIPRVDRAWIVS